MPGRAGEAELLPRSRWADIGHLQFKERPRSWVARVDLVHGEGLARQPTSVIEPAKELVQLTIGHSGQFATGQLKALGLRSGTGSPVSRTKRRRRPNSTSDHWPTLRYRVVHHYGATNITKPSSPADFVGDQGSRSAS